MEVGHIGGDHEPSPPGLHRRSLSAGRLAASAAVAGRGCSRVYSLLDAGAERALHRAAVPQPAWNAHDLPRRLQPRGAAGGAGLHPGGVWPRAAGLDAGGAGLDHLDRARGGTPPLRAHSRPAAFPETAARRQTTRQRQTPAPAHPGPGRHARRRGRRRHRPRHENHRPHHATGHDADAGRATARHHHRDPGDQP